MQFLKDAGFKAPTPIQAYTWPVLMAGKDVIGVAKTGSGKTLGYLLPGYIKVKRAEGNGLRCDRGPAMLVMAPTRELCQQIYEESDRFGKPAQIATACVYGGAPKNQQQRQLRNGPQCVAATPGRLNDFLRDGRSSDLRVVFLASASFTKDVTLLPSKRPTERRWQDRTIDLQLCDYLVLDEADRMLDMGFEPQIKELAAFLPQVRQTALYTATWPREDPTHIQVGSEDNASANADISQHIIKVRNEQDKMGFLERQIFPDLQRIVLPRRLERSGSRRNAAEPSRQRGGSRRNAAEGERRTGGAALIFVKTKKAAAGLYHTLSRAGAPIVCLHGDMDQSQRDHALYAFKHGKAKVLVATDVAQRGLDIKNVQFVVNYDAPANMEEPELADYVHRIGRTGRAGEKGDAYTCLYESETQIANGIMKMFIKAGQDRAILHLRTATSMDSGAANTLKEIPGTTPMEAAMALTAGVTSDDPEERRGKHLVLDLLVFAHEQSFPEGQKLPVDPADSGSRLFPILDDPSEKVGILSFRPWVPRLRARAMTIGIDLLRKDKGGDPELVKESEKRRFRDPKLIDQVLELDTLWVKQKFQLDEKRKEVNKVQSQITEKKKASKGADKCEDLLEQKTSLEGEAANMEKVCDETIFQRDKLLGSIGNMVHDSVPVSQDEDKDNKVVATWGVPRSFGGKTYQANGSPVPPPRPLRTAFNAEANGFRPHFELLEMIGAVEFDAGNEVAGHRGYFLTGPGVLLNQALINYGIAFLSQRGYTPLQPPFFMKKEKWF
eukprot:g10711.t1